MPQSSNYIKVRSGRALRRKNEESEQRKTIAGSNDVDNMPGASTTGPHRNPTGVPMPGQYETSVEFGEGLSTRVSGMGISGVGMPVEVPRDPLSSANLYPYSTMDKQNDLMKQANPGELEGSSILADGTVEYNPSNVVNSGTVHIELERTTSIDGDRIKRTRARHRRIVMKDTLT